jgi:hypothetical protein
LNTPALLEKLDATATRWKKKEMDTYTEKQKRTARQSTYSLWYGSINHFRPAIAKWLYTLIKPKSILDFTAGWGGRAWTAMSMGIPYIGIDSNVSLKTPYELMIADTQPTSPITMIFQPAETVDYSEFTYDCVLTSPPYFMIEKYENMPSYESKHSFLETFFIPVIKNVWQYLQPGGHLVLNMPEPMYDAIKDLLPTLHQELFLPLRNRHSSNASKKEALTEARKYESIYIWKKQND